MRRTPGSALCLAAFALGWIALSAEPSRANAGDLLWEERYDFDGNDGTRDVAGQGSFAFAAGVVAGDFLVRAYHAPSGFLRWQDQYDEAGGGDTAHAIAVEGKLVFVAGSLEDAQQVRQFAIRTYARNTGDLLWTDSARGAAYAVAAEGSTVAAAGGGFPNPAPVDFVVRAYDARTGARLWEDFFDRGGTFDEAHAVAVRAGRVIAAGYADDDLAVRAYDAQTGGLLWADVYDEAGFDDRAVSVAAGNRRVWVAGSVRTAVSDADFFVRCYDGDSGAVLWEDQVDVGANDTATVVVAKGASLFVAGTLGDDERFVVRSYDAAGGALLWQDLYAADLSQAEDLAVRGKAVYVTGWFFDASAPSPVETLMVRAYDRRNGSLFWHAEDDAGGDGNLGTDLAIAGSRLIVGSSTGFASPNIDFGVRVYGTK